MSFYHGLGMFIFGMGATIFGAIVAYFIINKVMEKKEDPKRFDGLKNEGSEYDKTCSQIAEKINFILKRIN